MEIEKANIEDIIIHYLDGSISPEESEQLLLWLKESESNQKIFLDYCNIWSSSNNTGFDEANALQRFMDIMTNGSYTMKRKNHRKKSYVYAGIAAACAAVILLTLPFIKNSGNDDIVAFANKDSRTDFNNTRTTLVLSDDKSVQLDDKEVNINYESENIKINEENTISKVESSSFNQLIIPFGKRSVVTFADGTKAWVNSGTRLVYPVEFNKDRREVFVDGEIYLEVAEDKSRPFIVKSTDMDVRVLGTKFNVSAYESEKTKSVVLLSGSVKVLTKENNKEETIMKPNQIYKKDNGNISVEDTDASKYILWIDGFYIFDSTDLGDILIRLSRYYNKNIVFDDLVAALKCSGKLDMKDDLGEILLGLTNTAPISYEENKDGTYIVKIKN